MSRYQRKPYQAALLYATKEVFAAACAAQRINGDYIKLNEFEYVDGEAHETKIANKQLTRQFLEGAYDIIDADREEAEIVRAYYCGLTFKILQGTVLSDFDQTALSLANSEEVSGNYSIALISSLPSCYLRSKSRDDANRKITYAKGGYIGQPKDKVQLDIEVIRCNYSQNWDTFFVTAITSDDQPIFFSYSEKKEAGEKFSIKGTVKAHREDSTQLSRVKII